MDLLLLTDKEIEALFDADLITHNPEDQTPQIDPRILDRLDAGDSVRVAIKYVTTPKMADFRCPTCNDVVRVIATATLVMHRCPNSKPKKGEFRNLKRVKES